MHAPSRRRVRTFTLAAAVLCSLVGVAIGASAATEAPEPIRRTIWGQTEPENSPGQTLYLQRVVIDPGAELPEHFHEGTQLATIRAGVLTYEVLSGSVAVTRADGRTESFDGPATVKLRTGDTIVEPESLVHFGANNGRTKVVIELAALLHAGSPLSTAVGAQPDAIPIDISTTLTSAARTLFTAGPGDTVTYGWNRLLGDATVDGGSVTVDMLGNVQYTSGNGPFSGFVTFTFDDGSTLGVSMQGRTTATASSEDAAFAATLGVIGGTGKYTNATGSGTFTGNRSAALGGQVQAEFSLDVKGIT